MSVDIQAVVAQARAAAAAGAADRQAPADDREQLKAIAAEFESMLLLQMLRDMREAGAWEEEEGANGSFGALFETLDVELASHLARAKGMGMGLTPELLRAIDRGQGTASPIVPTSESASPGNTGIVAERPSTSESSRQFPVAGAVTSEFGWRRDPLTRQTRFHQGVDLRAAYGEEVRAAGQGRVVFSGEAGGYGTSVVVEHADGTRTRYAHLSSTLVRSGDVVEAGAPVGRAGRSGRATGTHVHFEVTGQDGRPLSPERWQDG